MLWKHVFVAVFNHRYGFPFTVKIEYPHEKKINFPSGGATSYPAQTEFSKKCPYFLSFPCMHYMYIVMVGKENSAWIVNMFLLIFSLGIHYIKINTIREVKKAW